MVSHPSNSGERAHHSPVADDESNASAPDGYSPRPNDSQVYLLPGNRLLPEHAAILSYPNPDILTPDSRQLLIVTDTIVCLRGLYAELHRDARFTLNALLANRLSFQSVSEITNYGEGMRNRLQAEGRIKPKIITAFKRAIDALDAFGIESSDKPLVERTRHGSGAGVGYRLYPDIAISDNRPFEA